MRSVSILEARTNITGLDLISWELKYLNNGKKQGWFYTREYNFFCFANISKGMAFFLHGLAYIWEVWNKKAVLNDHLAHYCVISA